MGQKHTLEDDLITFKLTSKQMLRASKKCEANSNSQKLKLKQAIEKGNMEGAKIYAQNVIREKNQALNFLKMQSRVDAVSTRLETAIRMQDVNKAMVNVVKGMSSAMKTMDVEKIAKTMDAFEKNFEDMDVRSAYMENAMDSTTSMTTPPEEVDNLIQKVADEHGLEVSGQLQAAGSGPIEQAETNKVDPSKDLEARLAALRN